MADELTSPAVPRHRRRLRLAGRFVARLLASLLAAVALLALVTPDGRYVARAAWEEGKILARRRPIAAVIADSAGTSPAERRSLQLVVDARRFALDSLQLTGGESFTTYSRLERDTLVLLLSAARRDTLAPFTWWFPVVGRFPYKGFFDHAQAVRIAASMREAGYDTYVRPASAFSTLGWFNDPLLSTTLRLDSLDLAGTVIHELTHNTLFVRGQVTFNESFASFVGTRGAIAFFRARGQLRAVRQLEAEWRDEKLLGSFWGATLSAIDSAYATHPADSAARVAARDTVFERMRRRLLDEVAPRLPTVPRARLERLPLDNAFLLARRVYAADLWVFDAVHERLGGSVQASVALLSRLAREQPADPFGALYRWLDEHPSGAVVSGGTTPGPS
ncbi:MAG: aminopeptidase [Gemmatimonadetes bacterium]|nr:aminopeptidase [Gemmatimonadota bacterium]